MADSHDPRVLIRNTIGTAWYLEEEGDIRVISITDDNGDTVRIPIRLSEETRTESLDTLPYIELVNITTLYTPQNIEATVRKREAYIDCHLYFTDTDNISPYTFGKAVMDELQDLIRGAHCTFGNNTNRMFVNIGMVRQIPEPKAHQVVFHYVCEIYAIHYDNC